MKKWTGAFQIAAVYVGTVIGAGFATGREIVEFFSRFGFYGFITILIAGYVFIFLGAKIMVKSIEIQATSFEDFNDHLFGKRLAKVMNIFMMVMLIGVCAVMLSGAEALFAEQLGISRSIGSLLTIVLTLIIMALGVKGLFAVNTFVVPILILFNLILMVTSVTGSDFINDLFFIPNEGVKWEALVAAFSYAAFNLTLAQAVLVPIAVEINDVVIVKLGGFIGGLLLTLILLSSHFTLITLPDFAAFDIPMAVIVKTTISSIYFIYLLIIYGEIFTSLIGNMYGLEKQLRNYISAKRMMIHSSLLVIILLISRVEYSTLLGFLYPIFGYVSLLFLVLLTLKPTQVNK